MKLRKANTLHLFRSDWSNLFTWSKQGILLKKGYVTINLNELEVYDALDILDNLLDEDLTYSQRLDVNDVKDEFIDLLENQ